MGNDFKVGPNKLKDDKLPVLLLCIEFITCIHVSCLTFGTPTSSITIVHRQTHKYIQYNTEQNQSN